MHVFPYMPYIKLKSNFWIEYFIDLSESFAPVGIKGFNYNIPFLISLITHPTFLAGEATTRMIDKTPELFELPKRRDRATRILRFIADTLVNGNKLVDNTSVKIRREPAIVPTCDYSKPIPDGYRQKFLTLGATDFCQSIRNSKELLLTDTTMRDAHQSLLATRFRTYDMLKVADAYARLAPDLFSLEMWGGATFDTSMRFLRETPGNALLTFVKRSRTSCFKCCFELRTPSDTPIIRITSFVHSSKKQPRRASISSAFSTPSTGPKTCASPWMPSSNRA